MNYFICDIVGTFNGATENREEELVRFVNNLNKIIELEGLEELIFSFESSDTIDFVMTSYNELEKYVRDTKIKLGIQFSNDKYYEDGEIKDFKVTGKFDQSVFLLENKTVNNVYFADDVPINHELMINLLSRKLEKKHKDLYGEDTVYVSYNKLVDFIPGKKVDDDNYMGTEKKGLDGLNDILENYIKKLEIEKSI